MHGWGLGLPFPCVFLLLTTMWSCHLYQYPISCCHHCIIRIFLLFSFRQKTTKANHACAYSKRNNERLRRCWWLRYGKIENQVQHEIGPQSYLLSPFQIIGRLTFLTLSLTTCFIQKFAQNITSFVVACFINTYIFFKNNLNLTMFAQIFR